jgi:hypothetical protein
MPASSTYTPIATFTTVNNTTTSYTFSSIPSTYTDLIVIMDLKATASSSLTFRANADSGANYWSLAQYVSGTTITNTRYTSQTIGYLNYNGMSFSSGQWQTVKFNLFNYNSTNMWKPFLCESSSFQWATETTSGQWRSTAAITSVSIFAGAYFDTGSTFTLYGITAA